MSFTIQDVTENPYNLIAIQDLIKIKKKVMRIQEIHFLNDFPSFVRKIIRSIKNQFMTNRMLIISQPDALETFIFKYRRGKKVCKYQISNDMSFHDDIIIMCYLSQMVINRRPHVNCEIMCTLLKIMTNKYYNSTLAYRFSDLLDFLVSINNFYPSVALPSYYCTSNISAKLLPPFKLPKIIFTPRIILLFPRSVKNPPIAIIIAVRVNCSVKFRTSQIPLISIYQEVLADYNNIFFPESLKLHLCEKWKIVIKGKEEYKFASCFTTYTQEAKNLIAELKPNDPDLEDILSKI